MILAIGIIGLCFVLFMTWKLAPLGDPETGAGRREMKAKSAKKYCFAVDCFTRYAEIEAESMAEAQAKAYETHGLDTVSISKVDALGLRLKRAR